RKIEINSEKELVGITNIMTINDYVKMMVMSYQNKYPDTELSKKLGISRKSLWEKRKKLDIEKKK
ncbi:MAG: DNA-binding response regulator, partial [Aliarcobacter butzleri]|nr:DNA-binding response regulator [Aliarcobacter butzleri]